MAVDVSTNDIRDLSEDWSLDTREGKPYSGESVQKFIKKQLMERFGDFLVRSKYSADDVEAIQLNYIENKTEKHKNEFNALKEWRSECKETARRILSITD